MPTRSRALVLAGLLLLVPDRTPQEELRLPEASLALRRRVQEVGHPDLERGYAAYQALRPLGEELTPAVPDLAALLEDGRPEVVRWAASLAYGLGTEAKPLLAPLSALLAHDDPSARANAAAALAHLGRDARAFGPELARLVEDEDEEVACWSRWAFACVDPDDALRDPRPEVRLEALQVLNGRVPEPDDAPLVPVLVALLDDPSSEIRMSAAFDLTGFGRRLAAPDRRTVVDAAREALGKEPSTTVREALVAVLGSQPELAEETVPFLIGLAREDGACHASALIALGQLVGTDPPPAAVAFAAESTRDPDPELRGLALGLLSGITPRSPELGPALASALADPATREQALGAALGIARLGVAVDPEWLLPLLAENPLTRRLALHVLAEQGDCSEEVLEQVRARRADEDSLVRLAATGALARLEEAVAPELWRELIDTALEMGPSAQAAANELCSAAPSCPRVHELLSARLESGFPATRLRTALLLLRIERGDAAALHAALSALEEDAGLASEVLGRGVLAAPFVVSAPSEREAVLTGLARSGPRARPELPWLRHQLGGAEPELAARIAHAIDCIRGLERP